MKVIVGNQAKAQEPKAKKSPSAPFTKLAQGLQAIVDAGTAKLELSAAATTPKDNTALEEWKRKRDARSS